ncbi:CynX/NimT family MFS transporter [Rhodohalobacter sulfatireducens]|uniref:MFS transporter n=1 Tax=Rhodohalobacter sulfatireducens TaxID=2911366 RepID=A0ABS9KA13_9BACT|nr:MFS transporter [Rhodohalobacter sulfatireducens]MCG2587686.1 MFS transporter [Rhodohalobacter sulfatireducens]
MSTDQKKKYLLILVIILISLNLRPSLTAVGPLVTEIRMSTGLSNSLIGLLTTLPVLAFGIFSVLTPLFTRKMGTEGTMAFALSILTIGIFLRVIPAHLALFGGTLILGIGIALGNVLLPGIVKKQFPQKAGLMTGIYSSMLGVGATIASGVSIPLSEGAGLGWRWTLASWGILSALAFFAWLPQLKVNMPVIMRKSFRSSLRDLGTSALAWHIAVFVGLQSLTFYTLTAWLPEILIDRGMTPSHAGWMLSIMHGVGVLGTFAIPPMASKKTNQQTLVFWIAFFEMVSIIGLVFQSSILFVAIWSAILGFCLGGSFGLALFFILLRSRDSDSANELSGMSQSIGYTIAAVGPVLFGAFFDLTQNWTVPLLFLFLVAFIKLWSGWKAGKNEFV